MRGLTGEFLAIAIVISVVTHVGLMRWASPKVMTHVGLPAGRTVRREAMRVTRPPERPEAVPMDSVKDVDPEKDAPPAVDEDQSMAIPDAAETVSPLPAADIPKPDVGSSSTPIRAEDAPMFSVEAIRLDGIETSGKIGIGRFEAPSARPAAAVAPKAIAGVPKIAAPVVVTPIAPPEVVAEPAVEKAAVLENKSTGEREYVPIAEVLDKVDEKVVEEEKAAVRSLIDAPNATELVKYVNVTMSATSDGNWRYFKVMMSPRSSLKIIPKDLVILIDASGSIARDRMRSIRAATKQLLRSATNGDDRFNLVAFRDRYSYAFKSWQDCTERSFKASDEWLDEVTPHGRTDVFATISSVLTLPRDPMRPLIALVITDGDANTGVQDNAGIISRFSALNDGLVSVYMYGVRSSANRELIGMLTRGNRGESFIFTGDRGKAGSGIEGLSECFRDPVLTDLRVIFAAGSKAEVYPQLLRNIYRCGMLEFCGRVPSGTKEVAFSLKGLNGREAFESFFKLSFATASSDSTLASVWETEKAVHQYFK